MGMHKKRHQKSRSVLAYLLSVLVAPAALMMTTASAQEKPDSMTAGIQLVTATDISVKQRGWAEAMLDASVDWITFDSGKDAVLGLGVGGADLSLTGSAPAAFGLSSGVNGEVVWIYHLLGANEALVVQPDSGIESIEDLKGGVVAVPFGTTTHFDLLKALEQAGMSPQDVKILDMSPQTMAAAFGRGDIDAGWVWYPALARLLDAGARAGASLPRRGAPRPPCAGRSPPRIRGRRPRRGSGQGAARRVARQGLRGLRRGSRARPARRRGPR